MNKITKLLTLCVFILLIQISLKANKIDKLGILGQWGGRIEYAERLEAINILFYATDNLLSGNITLVYDKKVNKIESIQIIDSTISFECNYDKGKLYFKGKIGNGVYSGQLIVKTPRVKNLEGRFELNKGQLIEEDKLFLERLMKYADYKNENITAERTFEYMDSTNSNLKKLRNKYNLDSLAGTGSELSRMINLMKWVHNILPYNGHCGNFKPLNSLSLIESKEARDSGINCLMKSIILNEVYLAMGFPSRRIHCLPKGNNHIESHHITIVYSSEFRKWIYMDSSVGSYLMDESRNLLSIQEFREKLIKGEKILINNDALLPNDLYLHYMSKNLFRFSCSYISGFNSDAKDNTSCHLYPKRYLESQSNNNNTNIVSNPTYFWTKPNFKYDSE